MITHVDSVCVVDPEGCAANLKSSLARSLPLCSEQPERKGKLAVVGAGPSVRDYLDELRGWPGEIWAINGAYDYLIDNGIIPEGFLGVDPLPGLAEYVANARPETTFYMSGLSDPAVLDVLASHNVNLWFPEQESVNYPENVWKVGGGTTAITRAPFLARMLGWRDITLFGADSSFDKSRYVYGQKYAEDSKAKIHRVICNGEGPFFTELPLMKQVSQLGVYALYFEKDGKGKISFRCGGLLEAYLKAPLETDDGVYAV